MIAGDGTIRLGITKSKVYLAEVEFVESEMYVNGLLVNIILNGLSVVLTVILAGTPSLGVDGVSLVAYVADVLDIIQLKVARLVSFVLPSGLYT